MSVVEREKKRGVLPDARHYFIHSSYQRVKERVFESRNVDVRDGVFPHEVLLILRVRKPLLERILL